MSAVLTLAMRAYDTTSPQSVADSLVKVHLAGLAPLARRPTKAMTVSEHEAFGCKSLRCQLALQVYALPPPLWT